jgi:hypothetical protein
MGATARILMGVQECLNSRDGRLGARPRRAALAIAIQELTPAMAKKAATTQARMCVDT